MTNVRHELAQEIQALGWIDDYSAADREDFGDAVVRCDLLSDRGTCCDALAHLRNALAWQLADDDRSALTALILWRMS